MLLFLFFYSSSNPEKVLQFPKKQKKQLINSNNKSKSEWDEVEKPSAVY